jgi:hypothetical protein
VRRWESKRNTAGSDERARYTFRRAEESAYGGDELIGRGNLEPQQAAAGRDFNVLGIQERGVDDHGYLLQLRMRAKSPREVERLGAPRLFEFRQRSRLARLSGSSYAANLWHERDDATRTRLTAVCVAALWRHPGMPARLADRFEMALAVPAECLHIDTPRRGT